MGASFAVSTGFYGLNRLSPMFKKMGRDASGLGNVMRGAFRMGAVGLAAVTTGATLFVREAAKIEDATAAFTPLLGSTEKATQLVARLNKEAATTPFQFEGIAGVAKQLLPVMNGSIEDTANAFRMLGDTAGGNIQKLDTITRGYTKALLKGKPDMEALNMISEAGVPIFAEMSKNMGITTEQLFELSRQGKLTNDDLTNTFKSMTREGGIFYRGMAIASETFTGRVSTLKDNIALTAAAIGQTLMPTLKPLVDRLIEIASAAREWVTQNQDLIKTKIQETIKLIANIVKTAISLFKKWLPVIAGVTAALIAYKIAMIAAFLWTNRMALAMKAAAAMGAFFNAVLNLSPIMKFVILIGLLVAAAVWLWQNWDKVTKFFIDSWEWIKNAFWAGVDVAKNAGSAIVASFVTAAQAVLGVWDKVKTFFTNLWETTIKPIVTGVADLGGKIGQFFSDVAGGVSDFFGGDENKDAPNRREAEARQQIQFQGQLNIAGAPAGSTINSETRGAPPIRMEMLGAQ